MPFDIPAMKYTGRITEVTIGNGEKAVTVGGETCYPFYTFEGEMRNAPMVAFEVLDFPPEDWQDFLVEPYGDVISNPAAWARKCVESFNAEVIALQLKSADPNGLDRDIEEVVKVVKDVSDAVDVPLIVWGTSNDDKDALLLKRIAEVCEGRNLLLGPLSEKNYKQIGAMAIGYNQTVMASTPIDVNLAKQLNILLGNLGVSDDRIIMDPTTGSLGYGLEYTYSVMERDRMAALTQEDVKLQFPLVCNVGQEVWKTKETRISGEEDPKFGDTKKRSILIEAVTSMTLLMAGADIVIVRHPDTAVLIRDMIKELTTGR